MFRKDSAMIKAWEQNGPEHYAAIQEEILQQALPMLKPGGMLLYSTCTFSPLEDEGMVEKILAMDSGMELVDMKGYEGFVSGMPELIGSGDERIHRCVRMFPHRLEGEGHFLALFRRSGETECAGRESASMYLATRKGLKGEEKSCGKNLP